MRVCLKTRRNSGAGFHTHRALAVSDAPLTHKRRGRMRSLRLPDRRSLSEGFCDEKFFSTTLHIASIRRFS
jgi:hypothetical protein